jgi:hypothetical protein
MILICTGGGAASLSLFPLKSTHHTHCPYSPLSYEFPLWGTPSHTGKHMGREKKCTNKIKKKETIHDLTRGVVRVQ